MDNTTGWRSMDNAPRDGTPIEVRGGAGPYGITSWRGKAKWHLLPNRHRESATWCSLDNAELSLAGYYPTEWRPL